MEKEKIIFFKVQKSLDFYMGKKNKSTVPYNIPLN